MNFIKSVSKSVEHGVLIVTLDGIIDDIKQKYEKELNNTVQNRNTFLTCEEAEKIETDWFALRNESYDRQATKATGKPVPDDWQDNKDLICVRKRMLNRELQKLKGQLLIRVEQHSIASKSLYLDVLQKANDEHNKFLEEITTRFPLTSIELDDAIHFNTLQINNQIKALAPTMDELVLKFNDISLSDANISWDAFQTKLTVTSPAELKHQNALIINARVNKLKEMNMEQLRISVIASIEQQEASFLSVLMSEPILLPVEASMLHSEFLKQLGVQKQQILASLESKQINLTL